MQVFLPPSSRRRLTLVADTSSFCFSVFVIDEVNEQSRTFVPCFSHVRKTDCLATTIPPQSTLINVLSYFLSPPPSAVSFILYLLLPGKPVATITICTQVEMSAHNLLFCTDIYLTIDSRERENNHILAPHSWRPTANNDWCLTERQKAIFLANQLYLNRFRDRVRCGGYVPRWVIVDSGYAGHRKTEATATDPLCR